MFGILILSRPDELLVVTKFTKRFSIYLIVAVLTLYFAPEPFIGFQKALSYFLLLLVIPNVVVYEYRRMGKLFFSNLVAFSVIIHFISIAVMLTFPEVGITHGGRWNGAFGNPNGLGLYLIVTYTLYRAITLEFPGIFSRREHIFYLLLAFTFLWMSGSRTIGLSISVFELSLQGFKYSRQLTVLAVGVFIIYFDYINEFIVNALYQLGLSQELRLDSLDEGSGRFIAWQFAWEHIQQKTLIFGKGLGYDEELMRANAPTLTRLGHEGGVHNSYLILWLDTGIIGLVAFLFSLLSLFIEGFKKKPVLISANFEPWITASLNPYTCTLLCTMTLMLIIDDKEKEVDQTLYGTA